MLKLRKKNTSDLIGVYMLELAEEQEQKRVGILLLSSHVLMITAV